MPSDASDEWEVVDTLYRFAQGIDFRDWSLLRGALCDEILVDYTSYRGGEPLLMGADDWVAKARRRFETMTVTQHSMTNARVEARAEGATCAMYVEAHHVAEVDGTAQHCRLGGRYRDEMRRVRGEWRISVLRLEVRWIQGDRRVLDLPVPGGSLE